MKKQWRWLVVGGGSIGCRHLQNLRLLGQKDITLFEPKAEQAAILGKKLKVPVVLSLEEGLKAKPEAAMICSPTRFHLEQSSRCLKAGCALFVEKPLSDRWTGVETFLGQVGKTARPVLVGCNFRFHPGLKMLHQLLQKKLLGDVVSLRAEFGYHLPFWHPWEDYRQGYSARKSLGGGVALDRIHEFDLLRWLGGDIRSLSGRCQNTGSLEIDTEDIVQAEIDFASGAWGSLQVDYLRRSYRCVVDILGTEGHATWDYSKASLSWWEKGKKKQVTKTWPDWDSNQMYLDELNHFLKVLSGQAQPAQSAEDAAKILRWVLKLKASS